MQIHRPEKNSSTSHFLIIKWGMLQHQTHSWNSAKSAQHTLHIPEILWSLHNTQAGRCYTKKPVYTTLELYPIAHNNTDPFTPPVQQQKQQQQHWVLWHLLYSNRNNNNGSFHGASSLTVWRKLGGLKRRNKLLQHKEIWSSCASSNKGVLPQVWVTRNWTLDLTLQTGYPHNTGLES